MPQATEAVLRTANAAAEITEGAPVSAHRTTAKTIANRVTPKKTAFLQFFKVDKIRIARKSGH